MDNLRDFISNQFIPSISNEKTNKSNNGKTNKNSVTERAVKISEESTQLHKSAQEVFNKNLNVDSVMMAISRVKTDQTKLNKELKSIEKKINSVWTSVAKKTELKTAQETLNDLQKNKPKINENTLSQIQNHLFDKTKGNPFATLHKAMDVRDLIKSDNKLLNNFDIALLKYIAKQDNPGVYLNFIPKEIILTSNKKNELQNLEKQLFNLSKKRDLETKLNNMGLVSKKEIYATNAAISKTQREAASLIKEVAQSLEPKVRFAETEINQQFPPLILQKEIKVALNEVNHVLTDIESVRGDDDSNKADSIKGNLTEIFDSLQRGNLVSAELKIKLMSINEKSNNPNFLIAVIAILNEVKGDLEKVLREEVSKELEKEFLLPPSDVPDNQLGVLKSHTTPNISSFQADIDWLTTLLLAQPQDTDIDKIEKNFIERIKNKDGTKEQALQFFDTVYEQTVISKENLIIKQDLKNILKKRDNLLAHVRDVNRELKKLIKNPNNAELLIRDYLVNINRNLKINESINMKTNETFRFFSLLAQDIFKYKDEKIDQFTDNLSKIINLDINDDIINYLHGKNSDLNLNLTEEAINEISIDIQKNGVVEEKMYI